MGEHGSKILGLPLNSAPQTASQVTRTLHIPSLCSPPVHASPFDQHGRDCQEAQNLASIDRNA